MVDEPTAAAKRTYRKKNNLIKRGNVWYARIFVDGKDTWRAAGRDRKSAQEFLGKLRGMVERGQLGLAKSVRHAPLFKNFSPKFLEWAEAHKRSAERDRWCMKQLDEEFGELKLPEIRKPRVEAWMLKRLADDCQKRSGKVSKATVNRQVALLRRVLNFAVAQGEIEANPIAGIRLFEEPPPRQPNLSPEDESLLLACEPAWFPQFVKLAIACPARVSDLLALRWKDIDFEAGTVSILDQKENSSRKVPLHPELIAEFKERRGAPDGWVIVETSGKHKGQPPTVHGVGQAFRRAAARIPGIAGMRPHDLRHVGISRLNASGASIPEIMSMSGHRQVPTALRYAHSQFERLQSLVAKVPLAAPAKKAPPAPEPVQVIDLGRRRRKA